ncbi:uncharacterized protein DUF3159 [Mycolicibacterium mucogenicum 261Sha1.1M5]|uniref:DUF3159 domain-containing protein n=1 Tax=Leucobacter aridicollis TaxID=283878 RepID=A0A852R8P7_9MICO|nr:DUF3159 domain-containing protein [Leucobacter aridicollis]MBL3682151.1 DUF3159 domain-containing protein [Leucobacter aridicollis]NYD26799.1 hypothetical protein [Leucobacter aridicollis]RKQ94390.1 uncharacterized protein DUF3159 [Mycolicibacterium mucogenicum 261Sha1.1M5]
MSDARPDPDQTPEPPHDAAAAAGARLPGLNGGIARAVRAGADGEELTAQGVFAAIGGVRGLLEAIVPSLIFVVLFVITKDARLSALVPGALALLLVLVRLVRRETIVSALSGMLGVGVAVIITLITGRGVDYFLSGFVVNIAWGLGLLISILVGWPAVGLLIGMLDGDMRGWRKQTRVRRTALWLTVMWLGLFVARLAVQLPMYLSERVEALGVARIVMGVPLFAVIIVATWFAVQRLRSSSDDSNGEKGVISGENTPSM